MEPSILQTELWETFQKDLHETTFFRKEKDYTILCIKKQTPAGPYLYLPYGPYLRTKSAAQAAYKAVLALAQSEHAIFIRIEPQSAEFAASWLEKPNCQKTHDLNPADTWVLDLTPEKSALISGFAQGTRTRYNTFAKKGLTVTTSKNPADIHHLVRLQATIAKNKKISVFSEEYLQTELKQPFATLYLVHYAPPAPSEAPNSAPKKSPSSLPSSQIAPESPSPAKKVIAASLFFDDAHTRYYMQSAADYNYRKLPATVALLTTALFDAKEKGLKNFDFWGIAPEKAPKDHPWAGFTDFKKSFGGTPHHYAGTHDIILNPKKYQAYRLLRKTNRLLRKLKK